MHGYGTYLYDDGFTTKGDFKHNWPDGEARSEYPRGDVYDGEWKRGRFSGRGKWWDPVAPSTKVGGTWEGGQGSEELIIPVVYTMKESGRTENRMV